MKVKILDCTKKDHYAGETLEFQLSEVDNAFANALRRVLLSEIPVLGIESVTIAQNTSVFADEMIAHRLGLVPLYSMKARRMRFARECDCGGHGCGECQITGELVAECPSHQHSLPVYINETLRIDDEEVFPVSSEERGILLLTLGRSQKLRLKIIIRKNIAKIHAKFMPVATVAMRYAPEIILHPEGLARLGKEKCQQWVNRCPRQVFAYDESSRQVKVVNPQDCIFCRECTSTEAPFSNLPEPLVFVRQKRNAMGYFDFIFVVESTGVLPVMHMMYDAIEVLQKKLLRIQAGLSEDPNGEDITKTRLIGGAPTALAVLNEDGLEKEGAEDNLYFVMQ